MKRYTFNLFFSLFAFFILNLGRAQIVNIPDANSKAKLLQASPSNTIAANLAGNYFKIDTNGDRKTQVGELFSSNGFIASLEGIQSFKNLKDLNCYDNQLTSLDIKRAPELSATEINLKWYENTTSIPPLASTPTPNTSTLGTQSYWETQSDASRNFESIKAETKVNKNTPSAISCSGSFGDPIFNETFGSVNTQYLTISPALEAPAFTTYTYTNSFPPNDGSYTISNRVLQPSWGWLATYDHTQDNLGTYGNMMVVNASYNPGEFYKRRVSKICENQIYRFSMWIVNLHHGIKPNVTMKIVSASGVTLGSLNTGNLPFVRNWVRYNFDFQTTTGVDEIDVILINNAPGGGGNDLAIDDISFRPCGSNTSISANIPEINLGGVCGNSKNITLTANLIPNIYIQAKYIWQRSIDKGITWTDLNTASTQNTIDIKAKNYLDGYMYRFKVGDGNNVNLATCSVLSDNYVFKIKPIPAKPIVPTPLTYCQNQEADALTATGKNLKWYKDATSTTPLASIPIPDTAVVGTSSYWVTQSDDLGNCESDKAEIKVKIVSPLTPPIVKSLQYCQNQEADALTATGKNLKWYKDATSTTPLASIPIPDTAVVGTSSYWVTQSDDLGNCESAKAEIKVKIVSPLTPPIVKSLQYCQNQEAVALTATGKNLKWYKDATSTTPLASIPIPDTAVVGTSSYWVTQSDNLGNCESAKAEIKVKIVSPLTPPIVNPLQYCQNQEAVALTATGNNLKWYKDATSTTPLASIPIPDTAVVGTSSYWVTQSDNLGNCESAKAEIKVTIVSPLTPPIVNPLQYCQNQEAVALTATGNNLKWYKDATSTTPLASIPIPDTAVVGTSSYWVTQSDNLGNCESAKAEIKVTIVSPLTPPIVNPLQYCQNQEADALTATGNNLKWYKDATSTTPLASIPIPDTAVVGTSSYWVTQSDNLGNCESAKAEIKVTIVSPLTPPIVNPLQYCQNQEAVALTATGNNLKWYKDATSTTPLASIPIPDTAVVGTSSYWVTQSDNLGNCESAKAEIKVTIVSPLTPPIVNPLQYCQNQEAVALTATGKNLKWYKDATSTTPLASIPIPDTSAVGTSSYWVTQSDDLGNCESAKAEIKVKIVSPLTPPIVKSLQYCQNQEADALTATGKNLKWYKDATSTTPLASIPIPDTSAVGTSSYWVTQSDDLGNCESAKAEIKVKIVSPLTPPIVKSLQYCQNQEAVALTATGNNLKWYKDATSTTPLASAPIPDTSVVGTSSYWVTQSDDLGNCESAKAEIKVKIVSPLTPPIVNPLQYCQNQEVGALTATGNNLKWYKDATSTTPLASAPIPDTSVVGTSSYWVTQSDDLGNCESAKAEIKVTVVEKIKIINIITTYTSIEIIATGGTQPYVYSLDNVNWQSSNVFYNLKSGMYTVYVKSANVLGVDACITIGTDETAIVKIVNIITPNSDGKNDAWKINDMKYFPNATLYIYDRYGKLLKTVEKGERFEWDGKYLGRSLPSATYWYQLDLGNGTIKSGWFVIKNRKNTSN